MSKTNEDPKKYDFGLIPSPIEFQFIAYAKNRETGEVYYQASHIANYFDFHLNKVSKLKEFGDPVMLKGLLHATFKNIKSWLTHTSRTRHKEVVEFLNYLASYDDKIRKEDQFTLDLDRED